ncbi:hypothetical protein EX895_000606 [Sporisorium graminicola]|uniref:Uncharacterized protein n=1 Tax=Sporisorium graminicola TaxID=280036 RepID=A0A4U7L3V9_9BASI|nr:hypothetical protein EX895_000606 [Sporisorium graminicola]TKY90608.1 hypothetical protein EX895_000606 [Sporisorium graminicola]
MTRQAADLRDETTPLLSHSDSVSDQRRWSLARRRSSAFLSFLSEPEDKDGDEYVDWKRKRSIFLIVGLSTLYNVGTGISHSYIIELVQTLACAEYYYSPSSDGTTFPTLPSTDDPFVWCSIAPVDKRTSQMGTYMDTFSSLTACVAALVLAKTVLPRVSRRTIGIALPLLAALFSMLIALIPAHYSFDAATPPSSNLHPTTGLHLLLLLYVVAGLLGVPQVAPLLLSQVMVLDVCRDDEKTSAFAFVYAALTLGMGCASIFLRFVLPVFGLDFSVLRHTGPFSPFWMVVISHVVTLILAILFLPETKPKASAQSRPRTSSVSSDDDLLADTQIAEAQQQSTTPSTTERRSSTKAVWETTKETLSLFSYLVPYKPSPDAKRDFKLPLMLCAVITCDTITTVWGNLIVFCSTHLRFGPKEVATLLGIVGAGRGLFSAVALPFVVKAVRRIVASKMRQELRESSVEEVSTETRHIKREESVIRTDKLVASGSLVCDSLGFLAMSIAASHLSANGIYGSATFLLVASGALPAIQALCVDFFLAQNRPTDDPVAARDAFVSFVSLLLSIMMTVGPLINNAIYQWSIDHSVSFLVFLWTATLSLITLMFVTLAGIL